MLKGITLIVLYFVAEMSPFAACEGVRWESNRYNDSIKPGAQVQVEITPDKIKKRYNQEQLDSIFLKSDKRSEVIQIPKKAYTPKVEIPIITEDTSIVRVFNEKLFNPEIKVDLSYLENFLLAIPTKNISQHFDTSLFTEFRITRKVKIQPIVILKQQVKETKSGLEGKLRVKAYMNWLTGLLLFSLFIFSWVRVQYKKYVNQVINSLINYQVSLRLLRERNVLFRNMSFGLNFVFAINVGLFIFFLLQDLGIKQQFSDNILNIVLYSSGLVIFYSFKFFICKVIGYLFKVQTEFIEYVHNINLFNKNIGLFLFPIVIGFPYVHNSMKPVVIYIGVSILVIMFFLRTIRSIQIIMRKGVSLFYLILYLCAIEILPVLIVVKYSATLV